MHVLRNFGDFLGPAASRLTRAENLCRSLRCFSGSELPGRRQEGVHIR